LAAAPNACGTLVSVADVRGSVGVVVVLPVVVVKAVEGPVAVVPLRLR